MAGSFGGSRMKPSWGTSLLGIVTWLTGFKLACARLGIMIAFVLHSLATPRGKTTGTFLLDPLWT